LVIIAIQCFCFSSSSPPLSPLFYKRQKKKREEKKKAANPAEGKANKQISTHTNKKEALIRTPNFTCSRLVESASRGGL